MSLKGNLKTFDLGSIFQFLENDKKSGVLEVQSEENIVRVFVKEGGIVNATTTQSHNRLGNLLRVSEVITDEQLARCLKLGNEKNQVFGNILLEEGLITTEILQQFVQKQAENTIFDLFLWEKGDFEYKDVELNPEQMAFEKLNTMHLLLEATRRIDEMRILKKQIHRDDLVFIKCEGIKSKAEELNEQELSILSLINGRYTVRQLVGDSGYDNFVTYKVLNSLIASGYIELCEVITPQKCAEEEQDAAKIVDDNEKRPLAKLDDEKQGSFFSNIIFLLKRQKRFSIIIVSIIAIISIIVGSMFCAKHIKSKRISSTYQRVMMQVENQHELEEKEKLLQDYLKSNEQNVYTQNVGEKLNKIRSLMEERDYKSTLNNTSKLFKDKDYVGIETAYQKYIDQYPDTIHADGM